MGRDNQGGSQVYGHAGAGLDGARWAANADVARIGQAGERRTGELLDTLTRRRNGPTVLHDLAIPAKGPGPARRDPHYSANIDHIVVSGRRVLLVDTKVWKPGRYWTLFGVHRHGWRRTAKAGGHTMRLGRDRIQALLDMHRLGARVATPVVAVWSSSAKAPVKVARLRWDGMDCVEGVRLVRAVRRNVRLDKADPAVVAALLPLVGALNRRAG